MEVGNQRNYKTFAVRSFKIYQKRTILESPKTFIIMSDFKLIVRTFISHRKINFSKFYKWVIFRSMKWYQLFEKYRWNLGGVPPEKIAQKEVKFPKNAIFHFFSCSAVHWKCNHLSRSGPYKIFADTMKWHQWLQKYQCN